MRILFLSAEVAPYVTVGGLSQVMYFLPQALKKQGHDVRIFTAKYGAMDTSRNLKKNWKLKTEMPQLSVPIHSSCEKKQDKQNNSSFPCAVSSYYSKVSPLTYFLENREYYELRANVFGYKDDHIRFALLSKGCLEFLYQLKKQKRDEAWWPDIIHCNDWHVSYFIELARQDSRYKDLFEKIPIVLTVHNFAFQGNHNFRYDPEEKRDKGTNILAPLDSPKLFRQNALLRGLLHADEVTTVSPTHAIEILTPEYAEGLDSTLLNIRGKLTGILNGLDTQEFNPSTDPIIKNTYTARSFAAARKKNKLDLQKEFGLEQNALRPLIAYSGRLSQQKGWETLLETIPKLLSEKPEVQIIVLGQGDEKYQNALLSFSREFPSQIGLHLQSDFRIPRRIYSGADILLLPSNFEPGGIVALEALRYGTVPIVRRTGGLNDIITEFNPDELTGNGFSFKNRSPWSLYGAIITALTIYSQKKTWNALVKNCLLADFSWAHAALEYETWYEKALEERKRATSHTPHPAYNPRIAEG